MRGMLVVLALGLAAPSGAGAWERVDARRSASPDGVVSIENAAGSIKVVGWDRPEVAVAGEVAGGAESLELAGGGRRTTVEVDVPGNPHHMPSHLEVHVPAGSRVEIDGFAAEITVSGVKGDVQAETVNGGIRVSGTPREVSATSVNGVVEISGATRRVKAESVNGAVTVGASGGDVAASTVNGVVRVTGGTFDRVELETVGGSVRFSGGLSGRGILNVETVSGSVALTFPDGVAADFSVSTFSGDVENELGPPARRTSRYTTEKQLDFSTGSGGATISVQTLSGGIALKKR
jgi:DUF4097 and DUF4098 domain-containing protein YvlB